MSRLLTRTHVFLLGLTLVVAIAGFVFLPGYALIPAHWGPNGAPDRYWAVQFALPLPVLAAIVIVLLAWLIGRFLPDGALRSTGGVVTILLALTAVAELAVIGLAMTTAT